MQSFYKPKNFRLRAPLYPGPIISPVFNDAAHKDAAGRIDARLEQVSIDDVAKLEAAFSDRLKEAVQKALPPDATEQIRLVTYHYARALSIARREMTPTILAREAEKGYLHLFSQTQMMLNENRDVLHKEIMDRGLASPCPGGDGIQSREMVSNLFIGGRTRIHFRLKDDSVSAIEPFVRSYLDDLAAAKNQKLRALAKDQGKPLPKGTCEYKITDYRGGYVTEILRLPNNEEKFVGTLRIGKLIADRPGLLRAFTRDHCRLDQKLMVVLTIEPFDIATASFNRGWQSCRTNNPVMDAENEIQAGVICAYLVRESDPYIHDPLARISLKPFDAQDVRTNPGTLTVYRPFNPIGLHHPGFMQAVSRFADETFNKNKFGEFTLRRYCEHYQEDPTCHLLPDDAEEALKQLDVAYTKDATGIITVPGFLDLDRKNLTKLPDFSTVRVERAVDVSNNKLVTLDGLPRRIRGQLFITGNLLPSLRGCPETLKDEFNFTDLPWLLSTLGAPESAEEFKFGNSSHYKEVYCIGPIEKPELFPGFMKK